MAESYTETSEGRIEREVQFQDRASITSLNYPANSGNKRNLHHSWWQEVLRGAEPVLRPHGKLRVVDLFSSVGGLSVGARLAIEAAGLSADYELGVDLDAEALEIYSRNLRPRLAIARNVLGIAEYSYSGRTDLAELDYMPEIVDERIVPLVGNVDLVLAGPPCQGHSNLNNHTRRDDPRNRLYVDAVATAVALRAPMIVVENVPDVVKAKSGVVETSVGILERAEYSVSQGVIDASRVGGGQTRRRHFLIATKHRHLPVGQIHNVFGQEPMTLRDLIGDLADKTDSGFMDGHSVLSKENEERIKYLLDNDLYNLPDHIRPLSHRNGHTYPSVYGRMYWDRPAQTITTGFMSPGRGRYIHPSQPRVITPREAARIQGFPDSFDFSLEDAVPTRKQLSKWIGDAVPTILGYVTVLSAISGFEIGRGPNEMSSAISEPVGST